MCLFLLKKIDVCIVNARADQRIKEGLRLAEVDFRPTVGLVKKVRG